MGFKSFFSPLIFKISVRSASSVVNSYSSSFLSKALFGGLGSAWRLKTLDSCCETRLHIV